MSVPARRRAAVFCAASVLATGAAALGGTPADAADAACTGFDATVSATRNGGALLAGQEAALSCHSADGGKYVRVTLRKNGDDDLGAAQRDETYSVKVRLDPVPRVVSGFGSGVEVERRQLNSGGYEVVITGAPCGTRRAAT